ncbi:antibiotic biosynthesis monooxygenase [Paenibacillus athensensis]|uniref:Antibiotic biosynthesis monooxygenase n=1 Tax=Paenibacillus athensensis TaxID=1967502 RepID=A0A4Y8Q668_9BACL|nr:antibiotic biosynthesis monooxygenase [Paenibacillus athensensis]MCD1259811.1 antibiotic biosynthesis monooxygenase [Paenibacillus athensensis]
MEKFGLYGKLTAQPGQRDELAALLLEAANAVEAADGCYLYIINLSEDEPDAIWVTEVWRDPAAHQASLALEETRSLIAKARPLIAGIEQVRLRTLGGLGL